MLLIVLVDIRVVLVESDYFLGVGFEQDMFVVGEMAFGEDEDENSLYKFWYAHTHL